MGDWIDSDSGIALDINVTNILRSQVVVVLRIVESRSPALRYRVGTDARRYVRLRRILPASTFERGVRRAFKLDAKS